MIPLVYIPLAALFIAVAAGLSRSLADRRERGRVRRSWERIEP